MLSNFVWWYYKQVSESAHSFYNELLQQRREPVTRVFKGPRRAKKKSVAFWGPVSFELSLNVNNEINVVAKKSIFVKSLNRCDKNDILLSFEWYWMKI